jgi:hypothetical protein
MRTVLDDCATLFLEDVFYRPVGDVVTPLRITVSEGVEDPEARDLQVGEDVLDGHAVAKNEASRAFTVTFREPLVWKVVSETLTNAHDEDEHDGWHKLRVYAKEAFLTFVDDHYRWALHVLDDAPEGSHKLYFLCTEWQVVYVVSSSDPTIEPCTTVFPPPEGPRRRGSVSVVRPPREDEDRGEADPPAEG